MTHDGAAEPIIHRAVSTCGRVDLLVKNAGIRQFEGAGVVSKALLNRHLDSTGGSIIQIYSTTALSGASGLPLFPKKGGAVGHVQVVGGGF
ncbi:hypothetical protein PENCOP_c005G01969 [Penicillium coprophilum]|uniref:Uncharacterized protein n=1 Tax=Penicillium coprophilum TaxID=36646 RepID=A0A1V6URR7_9EURO|nr:hypothetical protein PENCOP_c005G01969 [Penicillium coprophilum]